MKVPYPDALRAALGGLPSTRFEIVQAGSYTGNTSTSTGLAIAGAGSSETSSAGSDSVYVLSGGQSQPTALKRTDLIALGTAGLSKPTSSSVAPCDSSNSKRRSRQSVHFPWNRLWTRTWHVPMGSKRLCRIRL